METKTNLAFTVPKYSIVETKGQKYVLYKIHVNTPVTQWWIDRRYTQLREFKDKMDKVLHSKGKKVHLAFPNKMLFYNFDPEKIQDRQRKIENYLNRLAELINLVEFQYACDFLEMEGHIRTLLFSLEFEVKPNFAFSPAPIQPLAPDELDYFSLERKEFSRVMDFLKKLNREPLMIAKSVEEFETYYFQKTLSLTKEEIKVLLWGTGKLNGLLYFCGDTQGYIARNSCMQLFSKFLKYEYNSVEADKFVEVFGQTDPRLIRQMCLNNYIKEITSLDNSGLLSLYYYLTCNTHGINEPEDILKDKASVNEYKKWLQNKITCGYLFKMSVRKSSSKGTMAESKEEFEEDKTEDTPAEVMAKSLGSFRVTKAVCEASNLAATSYVNALTEELDGYTSWTMADSLAGDTIKIYNKDKKELRLAIQLRTDNVHKAAKYVFDPEKISKWANIKWNLVKRQGENQDVLQMLYPNTGSKYRYFEYVKYRTMKNSADNQSVLIIERSLLTPPTEASEVKRIHVNGCVNKLDKKVDTDGQWYVDWQILLSVEEGFVFALEYLLYTRKELESSITVLNKLLQF